MSVGLAAVAATALLSACADGPADPGGTASPPVSPPAVPPVTPPVTPHPPMPTPSPPVAQRTITGEVVAGVEMGCVLLRTGDGREHLLVGDIDALRMDATATVRGHPDPDLMTTCQQGVPFVVNEVVSP